MRERMFWADAVVTGNGRGASCKIWFMGKIYFTHKPPPPSCEFSPIELDSLYTMHVLYFWGALAAMTSKTGVTNTNIAKIANAVSVTLYSRVTMWVLILLFSNVSCNQCLKCQVSRIVFPIVKNWLNVIKYCHQKIYIKNCRQQLLR